MLTSGVIGVVLFAHWLADFFLQSDYMSKNKSKSNRVLSTHVGIYAVALFAVTVTPFHLYVIGGIGACLFWVALNASIHWATDWVTSRITSRLYAGGHTHYFFVVVGFDQLIHVWILLWSLEKVPLRG